MPPGALLRTAKHVHFVGIGGIGLSAIARILHSSGHVVSGSDAQPSALTAELAALGMSIQHGHRAEHIAGADLVVVSSAVKENNPEWVAALAAGIPVVKRSELLGEMMAGKTGIAVAGTHGKTTTAGWIAFVLTELGLDPTYVVGGILEDLQTNANLGTGPHFVVEADEYDHMFLGLQPDVAVVTFIDMDHPDCFRDIEDMTQAYELFLRKLPKDGVAIGCADQLRVLQLLQQVHHDHLVNVVTYGQQSEADWQASQVEANDCGGSDFLVLHTGQPVGPCRLCLPGLHNVSNALAVLAVAHQLGLDMNRVLEALPRFRGVRRRFEFKGEACGVVVIDDYAHHPTEIRATLAAARRRFGARPLWAFFQPHTFSRTKALMGEFARSFEDADHVLVSPIYAAREKDDLGISARDLVSRMEHRDVRLVADLPEASQVLESALQPGDVLLTLGAGDGYQVGEQVLEVLRARPMHRQALRPKAKEGMDTLRQVLGASVLVDEPLSKHTTFGIGGPADLFVVAHTVDELRRFVRLAWEYEVPYFLLGGGANLLVADRGLRGLVIQNRCQDVNIVSEQPDLWSVHAGSGAGMMQVAQRAIGAGLTGLEWAVDVPGTVGGAVVGNAGAFGAYLRDNLQSVLVLSFTDGERSWSTDELGLGYRTSMFKSAAKDRRGLAAGADSIKVAAFSPAILSAVFALHKADPQEIAAKVSEYHRRRTESQPAGQSAGSVFKRTEQYPAGFLIENAGLKGKRIGGAEVSSKHANFVINLGTATACDVRDLIDLVQAAVHKEFDVALELEIELVGDW